MKKTNIVLLISIILFVCIFLTGCSDSKEQTKNNSTKDEKETSVKEENPYVVTKDYDGIYKFSLKSENTSGYKFESVGVVEFNSGICKAKSHKYGDYERDEDYNGFCGLDGKNNSTFKFILNNKTEYECVNQGTGLKCELKNGYDLTGCTNNELDLIYVSETGNINALFEQIKEEDKLRREAEEEERKKQEEANFKESCSVYTFEELARNPDKIKGSKVKLTGEVVQTLYGSVGVDLRVNITKKGSYSTYYTDTVYVTYYPKTGEDKILENDIITIWGTSYGDTSYTSTLGATITLPYISAKYIDIN